jgi:hypothetical protein
VVFDHVSFEVESDDDLWELKDKIEAAGFWASEIVDHGFIHSLYTFDPNNIAIEFSAPVEGVDLRGNPRMIDKSASSIALEGSEPQMTAWPAVSQPTRKNKRRVYPGDGVALTVKNDETESEPTDRTPI